MHIGRPYWLTAAVTLTLITVVDASCGTPEAPTVNAVETAPCGSHTRLDPAGHSRTERKANVLLRRSRMNLPLVGTWTCDPETLPEGAEASSATRLRLVLEPVDEIVCLIERCVEVEEPRCVAGIRTRVRAQLLAEEASEAMRFDGSLRLRGDGRAVFIHARQVVGDALHPAMRSTATSPVYENVAIEIAEHEVTLSVMYNQSLALGDGVSVGGGCRLIATARG